MKTPRTLVARLLLPLAILLVAAPVCGSPLPAEAPSAPSPFAGYPFHDALRLLPAKSTPTLIDLGPIDAAVFEAVKEANAAEENKRLQVGAHRSVPQMPEAHSKALRWVRTPGGMAAHWRISSRGAEALRVALGPMRLARGAELRFASGRDPGLAYGPFAEGDIRTSEGLYWSPMLKGDVAIVEVFVPDGASIEGVDLRVLTVSHLFMDPSDADASKLAKLAGSCEVDLICQSATDSDLANAGKAVAKMLFSDTGGSYLCTGTLLNPTDQSYTPYFYTANHCISTQASASTLSTIWFYQSTGCGSGLVAAGSVQLAGGATLLYASSGSDVSFMRLNSTPPAGAWYAGWNASTVANGTALVGIHHPDGDVKKVSLATMGGYSSVQGFTSTFITANWYSGVTEGGSSGSGIFTLFAGDQNNPRDYRLRGGLYGGPSYCGAAPQYLHDYYSRLDVAWPYISAYLNPSTTSFLLSVGKAGTGSGTVTSSPAGISCGATCGASFASGTVVTLFASPSAGSVFAGWSGACSGTGSCVVTMSAARSVSATFNVTDDYTDYWANAAATALNGSTPGVLGTTADVDWFRFDFPGPGVWTISTAGSTNTVGEVYWPDGNSLFAADNDSAGYPNFSMTFNVGGATSAWVKVSGYGGATGAYTLVSSFDDFPDSWTSAASAVLNGSTPGILGTTTDEDWFRFDFPGSGRWTIGTSGSTDTVGEVYWPDGNSLLAADDDSAGYPNFSMTFNVNGATSAWLKVKGYGGTTTGAYTLVSSFLRYRMATDLNGDGRSDILWRNSSTGQIYRMLMNGFSIASGGLVYTEPNTSWKVVADADFNGDGITDLLWRNQGSGNVYMQFFNATGAPTGGIVFWIEPNAAWQVVGTPDFDGDGKADILWWNSATGQVYGMRMDGANIVAQGVFYTEPNTNWKIAAVGDFAGSGKRNQLLWRNAATGQVYLMTVNLSGSAWSQSGVMIYQEPNTSWQILAAADFNGDGKSDILWRNQSTGQVYIMLMNGAAASNAAQVAYEPNTAWKIVAQGDYDGDGKADLLWRNETTGQVYMMRMNGLAITAQTAIYQEPNTAWKILGPHEYIEGAK